MLPFTFSSLHKIQLALSMISFRLSLVYFRFFILFSAYHLGGLRKFLQEEEWVIVILPFGRKRERNPQISLSVIYLAGIQPFDWWLSTEKLSLQATTSLVCPLCDSCKALRLTSGDQELYNVITLRDLFVWCHFYFKIFLSLQQLLEKLS